MHPARTWIYCKLQFKCKNREFYSNVLWVSIILFGSGGHGLPLEVDRGLCRGWCRRWCPRAAGQGGESLMRPSVPRRPPPKETNRGRKRWRWTTLGWTRPLQSLCTCHTLQNNFPVIMEGKIKSLPPRSLSKINIHVPIILSDQTISYLDGD